MARPKRCNADYFSHDVHMRNDIKIKAVRRKYGHIGYSIWVMLLEHLGNCDYFEYQWNELNIELLTPDFDVESEELTEIVNYFIKLDLIQFTNGFIHCENLTERLMEYLQKNREGFDMGNSLRMKGNNSLPSTKSLLPTENPHIPSVNIDEVSVNTDTKVNKTKPNENKVEESKQNESKQNYGSYFKLYKQLTNYELEDKLYEEIYFEIQNEIGWDNFYSVLNLSTEQINKLDEVASVKLYHLHK